MTTTTNAQYTPDWLVAQLKDLISDAPEYVQKGASRLLDSFTPDIAEAADATSQVEQVEQVEQVDASDDEEHSEEEDDPL